MKPDIYTVPRRTSDPHELAKHRAAIMVAWADGAILQYSNGTGQGFTEQTNPSWNWDYFDYRIDPASKPKVMVPWACAQELVEAGALSAFFRNTTSGNVGNLWRVGKATLNGIHLFGSSVEFDWATIRSNLEWTTDFKTWHKCEKEAV